ncbi:MAG TPA: gamma-glutamyltransferase [Miltoncostaeaceae bacterium]|nr:gamma-glutamyltransferase [Miltoncostaeaceae bacterium]
MAVVAAGHPETARAGAEAIARGGNAVDGVVGAAYAAAVAEGLLTGPAAGGFLLACEPGGRPTLLDFFVAAPGLGPRGRPLDPDRLDSFEVPFGDAEQVFHIGPASVGVPGMVPGLAEASARLGRLAAADLVAPAAALARRGVTVTAEVAYLLEILEAMITRRPECAAIWAPEGRTPRVGERILQPELAESLEEIGRSGAAAIRDGPLARALVAYLEREGGLVTSEDLLAYRVEERVPLEVGHGEVTVVTNPPPSSGGVLIAVALRELAGWEGGDVGFYRAVGRAGRAANAYRTAAFAEGIRDPGYAAALVEGLVSRRPTGTTHVSAVDAEGGMASLSSSNGSGSGVVVPGTGLFLNNMLGEQDINPGGFGRLAAGVRMTSMMAPTLILRRGEPVLALGSAGSNRLRSAILQTVVSIVDCGLGLGAAVARPRVHPEGDGVDVELGVPEEAVAALEADAHRIRRWGRMNLFFGGVSVAGLGPSGLEGAGDPRRGGAAAGVLADGRVVDL